jgi:uncharacterized protein
MSETNHTPSPESSASGSVAPPTEPQQAPLEQSISRAFVGPDGIRAGWRLVIFLVIVVALLIPVSLVAIALNHGKPPSQDLDPRVMLASEALQFFAALLASWVMSRMEHRRVADYGLPLRNAFRAQFWKGTVIGFASITVLLSVMRLVGVFSFGTVALSGAEIYKYASIWGLVFLFVGFFEEFFFRGYPLFTLTTGMSFWPSAILLSALFGLVHHSNPGESWVGSIDAGAVGLLFCLMVRRTGDLWLPIGFHAAWDWGETFFYGVPDSGLVAKGHLFNPSFSGPVWLTGGTVGPEGSYLCFALLLVLWIIFSVWLREAKYPNPDALRVATRATPSDGRELSLNL